MDEPMALIIDPPLSPLPSPHTSNSSSHSFLPFCSTVKFDLASSFTPAMDPRVALLISTPNANMYTSDTEARFAFLFKMCMRKCGKNPLCFFSPVNGIRAETEEPIWSRAFSFGLIRLMSHPFFEFDGTDSLILILQFAVICRTDDRRPWKMPPLPEVDALKRLCSTMELCSGPLTSPISEIFTKDCTKESPPRCPKACLEAEIPYDRRLCERSSYYLQDPKHLVFLMLQIAKVVDDHPKPTAPHVTKERGFDVYSVTTVDLHNIRDALDTMELHYGEGSEAGEFTIPTNLILEKYLASSGIENDVPHGTEQLLDFIVRSTVRREREIFNAVTYRNQQ